MILYTPLPLELVLEGFDQPREYREIKIDGVTMVVEKINDHQSRIVRLISTNPNDFLSPKYQPGSIISLEPASYN